MADWKKISLRATVIVASGAILALYQNCGNTTGKAAASEGVTLECVPQDKPCLRYKLKITNLKSTKNGVGFMIQGDAQQGVRATATFSASCTKENETFAICPFNMQIQGQIKSDATTSTVKGDGRTLTATVVTKDDITTKSMGTMTKGEAAEPALCFANEDAEFFDGDFIPLDAFDDCDPLN